jgi:hypothetical protein
MDRMVEWLPQGSGSLSGEASSAYHPSCSFQFCLSGGDLALAAILSRYPDIIVDVYEAAQSFRSVGAGIGIWPRPS